MAKQICHPNYGHFLCILVKFLSGYVGPLNMLGSAWFFVCVHSNAVKWDKPVAVIPQETFWNLRHPTPPPFGASGNEKES